jgi:hypothetical protein
MWPFDAIKLIVCLQVCLQCLRWRKKGIANGHNKKELRAREKQELRTRKTE